MELKNTELKRLAVKYVRDKAKSRYVKTGICEICGSTEGVDFHHYNSVTELFNKWLKDTGLSVKVEEDVLQVRDSFIFEHEKELYEECVNLCHKHHETLHRLYGKAPSLTSAPKQKRWVELQKIKETQSAT